MCHFPPSTISLLGLGGGGGGGDLGTSGRSNGPIMFSKFGKQGGTPGKILVARCGAPPGPQSAPLTLGRAGQSAWDLFPHVGLQWGECTHSSSTPTPTPLPTWTSSSSTTPSHARLTARGVGPTSGRGAAGESSPGHRPRGPRSIGFLSPCLRSVSARRVGGWGQSVSAFPCPVRPDGECHDTVPPPPPIGMRGGS